MWLLYARYHPRDEQPNWEWLALLVGRMETLDSRWVWLAFDSSALVVDCYVLLVGGESEMASRVGSYIPKTLACPDNAIDIAPI